MTPEQINIAIAEACGWKEIHLHEAATWLKRMAGTGPDGKFRAIPDFCHDLNACHEMEKTLTEKEQVWYLQRLTQVRYKDGVSGMLACMMDKTTFATAPQRCEAFMRVKGLLKE